LSIPLLGLIPMDDQVVISTNTGQPLVANNGSKAGEAFWRIAMRLNGQADLPIEVPKAKKGFWGKIGLKLAGKN
jgi:septum site-determining protein MinD